MPSSVQTGFFNGQGFVIRSVDDLSYVKWDDQSRIPFELRIRGRGQFDYYNYKVTDTFNHLTGVRSQAARHSLKESVSMLNVFSSRLQKNCDGSTRRDYTYIDDVIQGTMAAFDYEGPLFDIFNLGESETIQLKELIAAIEKAVGKKAKINQLPEQPGDMRLTCADISKAKKLLGYNPTTRLSEGLPHFVDWFWKSEQLK